MFTYIGIQLIWTVCMSRESYLFDRNGKYGGVSSLLTYLLSVEITVASNRGLPARLKPLCYGTTVV